MKRLITLLAVAAAALSVALPSASALDPGTVGLVSCAFSGGATVSAGTPVTLTFAWGDRNRGLVQDYLNAQTTDVTIDGAPVADGSSLYGPIDENNLTRWSYATGRSLASGESMVVTLDILLSHRIPAGKDDDGHPLFGGPGSIFGGPLTCTITGV
jgi:ABC-type glycerol-3-phosphate transport system substrate-binding protein